MHEIRYVICRGFRVDMAGGMPKVRGHTWPAPSLLLERYGDLYRLPRELPRWYTKHLSVWRTEFLVKFMVGDENTHLAVGANEECTGAHSGFLGAYDRIPLPVVFGDDPPIPIAEQDLALRLLRSTMRPMAPTLKPLVLADRFGNIFTPDNALPMMVPNHGPWSGDKYLLPDLFGPLAGYVEYSSQRVFAPSQVLPAIRREFSKSVRWVPKEKFSGWIAEHPQWGDRLDTELARKVMDNEIARCDLSPGVSVYDLL
jgi:hypothetical protein